MESGKRDHGFDTIKGVLIYLVVLGHALSHHFLLANGAASAITFDIYTVLNSFHMPAFIFVSGYFSKVRDPARYVRTTLIPSLLPYLILNTALWLILSRHFRSIFTPQYTLWYLLSLFFWRAATPFFARLRHGIALSLAAVFALIVGFTSAGSVLSVSRTIAFFPFFLAGHFCTEEDVARLRRVPKAVPIAIGVALLSLMVFAHHQGVSATVFRMNESYHKAHTPGMYGAALRAGALAVGLILTFCIVSLAPTKKSPLTDLGTKTMPIYLAHGVIIDNMLPLVMRWLPSFENEVVSIAFSGLLAAVICYLFSRKPIADGYTKMMNSLADALIV